MTNDNDDYDDNDNDDENQNWVDWQGGRRDEKLDIGVASPK